MVLLFALCPLTVVAVSIELEYMSTWVSTLPLMAVAANRLLLADALTENELVVKLVLGKAIFIIILDSG